MILLIRANYRLNLHHIPHIVPKINKPDKSKFQQTFWNLRVDQIIFDSPSVHDATCLLTLQAHLAIRGKILHYPTSF